MKRSITIAFVAVLALACGAAFAGYPVTNYLPPEVLAGLGALGVMPFMGDVSVSQRLAEFKTKRQELLDKKSAVIKTATIDEGRTFDEHETEQLKEFDADIKSLDLTIAALDAHEKSVVAGATVVKPETGRDDATVHAGVDVKNPGSISVKGTNLPPGLRFTRFSLAVAQAKGNVMLAHEIAKERFKDTPDVVNCLKAAISLGGTRDLSLSAKGAVTAVTSTDTAVTQYTDMENEFIDLLRPKTIMGRMDQLNRVPFMSRQGRQLTGVTGSFVGEGAPKPVQKQTFDNVTLGFAKVAVIVVLTDEAVRFSSIKAEMRARDDMVKGIATYIDKRFMDPTYAGVANVSPASITRSATKIQASGTSLAAIDADVRLAMAMFAASDVDPATAVWVMPATVALALSMKRNQNDEPAYPELSMKGGTWYGIPVIVSSAMVAAGSPAELQIALVTQEEVLLADDGGVSIDMSQEASLQMDDGPSAGAQSLVSLWQNNLVGIRAERYINWAPRRANSLGIALIENVGY